ncbi:MAG: polysaccharide biosynthesis/export family protein, partial [Ignavibacteria bacterium]|nr:polysaccharide biosynthesis/export family protein [Ignavibacteria bacterium]
MKIISRIILLTIIISTGCITQQKLAYQNNLPEAGVVETFPMFIPDYKIQYRDMLYLTLKAMTPDGTINDFLSAYRSSGGSNYAQGEAGQYLIGYDVNIDGNIILPVLGPIHVAGNNLEEARINIQNEANIHFNNATVECKLLSFKFT